MQIERLRTRFFEGVPRYQWLEDIGQGGNAIVFKAHDLDLDEEVAIKVLSPELGTDAPSQLARFKREISLNRKIKHPNVARLHDFGLSGDYPFLTMEFIPGKDLERLIRARGRIPPPEVVSFLRQIALGAQAAHELGIVHRDLKSSNVIVDDAGAAVILDFGLAKAFQGKNVTLDSAILGTPQYMPPEQALGKDADARSDIYSIGVIAFEALTGTLPYKGHSPMDIVIKVMFDAPPFEMLDAIQEVTPGLAAVVRRAMARKPEDRYPSAVDFELELADLYFGAADLEILFAENPAREQGEEPSADLQFALDAFRQHVPEGSGEGEPELDTRTPQVPFHVRPPRSAEPPPELQQAPKTYTRKRRPVVLVVDPDAAVRNVTAGALNESGCATLTVVDGSEALERLTKSPVDLILMAGELPGIDGYDVTRVVKSQPHFVGLPILLMSRKMSRSQFAFALQSGAADVIGMPIPPSAVVWRVWKILRRRGFVPPSEQEAQGAARPPLEGDPIQ